MRNERGPCGFRGGWDEYSEISKDCMSETSILERNIWLISDIRDAFGNEIGKVVSDDEDINDLKKKTALLAKAISRKKYSAKPTNNNLRTSSASTSANKKPDDSDQELSANMVFMAKMENILSDLEESLSYAKETIAEIVQIYLWSLDSGCSKHMTGNRALLTNFVEKFLRTVSFSNDDFMVIAGYGDVVIGSMMIKKVYYVEDDRSSNLYTIALNDIASNYSACLLAKASFSQSCYLLNNCDDIGKLKAKGDIGVFVAFRIYNKRTRKIPESVNVNFDEISEMASKQYSLEPGLSNLNDIEKYSNQTVSQVSETSKKDLEDLFHDF
ncbi:hypothetical protein Tco_1309728 [Tanacetum coccineum]